MNFEFNSQAMDYINRSNPMICYRHLNPKRDVSLFKMHLPPNSSFPPSNLFKARVKRYYASLFLLRRGNNEPGVAHFSTNRQFPSNYPIYTLQSATVRARKSVYLRQGTHSSGAPRKMK